MSKTLSLPAHLTSRPATMEDLEAVLGLFNACSIEQVGRPLMEETELQTDWKSPHFDLATDSRAVFAPDGMLVGHAAVWDRAPYVNIYARASVHPDYRGQSIGTALSRWAEERARRAISQAPQGARVVIQQSALSTDEAARMLLRQQGYQVVRHLLRMTIEMDGPPPEPVVPEGITIRPFVREREARALLLAMREAFRDHWGYVECPVEEDYEEWINWIDNDPAFDESLWFLAVDGEEIAGFSLCYSFVAEDPDMGEVVELGVRRPWRRRGLALALLRHSFGELYRRGKPRVVLGVDAQSLTGALRLYEKAGMHIQRRYDRFEKELRRGKDLSTQSLEE